MGSTVNELNTGKIAALSLMKELSSYLTSEIITEREVRETNSASVPLFLSAVLFNDWTLTNYRRLVSGSCVRTQNSNGRIGGG
jgi:hypothetical protein